MILIEWLREQLDEEVVRRGPNRGLYQGGFEQREVAEDATTATS